MITTIVHVEFFTTVERQELGCSHTVDKGRQLVLLRFGDAVTGREVMLCESCWRGVGRAVNGSSTPPPNLDHA